METERDKLLRLADIAAKAKGVDLVVREWQSENGPMMRLGFQEADSFKELAEPVLINFWRTTSTEAYRRVEQALSKVKAT